MSQLFESQSDLQESQIIEKTPNQNGFQNNELGDHVMDNGNSYDYIWDTPGFHDTNQDSKVQEIANQFYNCLLIKNVEKAKFLIVISEASIMGTGKQKIFKETIESFANMFSDEFIDSLKNSVGLLVNKAHQLKTEKNVIFAIKSLLDPQDTSLTAKAKKILKFTVTEHFEAGKPVWTPKSIHIYKEIVEPGPFSDVDGLLFQAIQRKIPQYFEIKQLQMNGQQDVVDMVISPEGAALA